MARVCLLVRVVTGGKSLGRSSFSFRGVSFWACGTHGQNEMALGHTRAIDLALCATRVKRFWPCVPLGQNWGRIRRNLCLWERAGLGVYAKADMIASRVSFAVVAVLRPVGTSALEARS